MIFCATFKNSLKIILMTILIVMTPSAIYAKTSKRHPPKKIHATHVVKTKKTSLGKITHKKIPVKPVHKPKYLTKKITKKTPTQPGHAEITSTPKISHSLLPSYLLSHMEKNLVNFVRNTVDSINYTKYKLGGTRIEPKRGVYVVDCSSYVDHILKTIYPRAYSSLTNWSGSQKPTTNDFYQYFRNLSDDARHWNTIDDAGDLRPGDILVFRGKTGGHVMVIMDMPERNGNILMLQIADAAPSGHSQDTRMPHSSGIGIGTMLLKINPVTSQPDAYAWKVGARWQSNVNFAMARPLDFS